MKLIACLVLLIAIMLQSGGLMLFYQAQRAAVYNEMHNPRDKGERELLQLTMDAATLKLAWVEKDEILYQGQMYDVESYTISGDQVSLQVKKDNKEQKLISQIDKLGGKEKSQADFMKRLMQLLTQVYIPPSDLPVSFCSSMATVSYSVHYSYLLSYTAQVLSPPPRIG